MQKINFEDATLVTQAKVTISGTDYEVTPATYSGGTDLDANTFNDLQDNIEASFKNTSSNSTTDGYSCKYVEDNFDKKEVYSTSEIDTGKIWTDDRKIYRRTFTGTINATSSWITIQNSLISNLRTITKMEGIYGGYLPIPSYINSSYSIALQYNSGSGVQIFSNGYNSGDVNVIVEYTKN